MGETTDFSRWISPDHEPLPQIADGTYFSVHFIGGLRGAKLSSDRWMIEPIFLNERPARSRPLSKVQMHAAMKHLGCEPLGFHDLMWVTGREHQHWVPYTGQDDTFARHPAALWAQIGANQAQKTASGLSPVRILADALSISLRGMDTAIAALSEFYFHRLVESLRSRDHPDVRTATSMDVILGVHVHSFVMHFGAARDYLGALIAHRAGLDFTSRKNDSLGGAIAQLKTIDPSKEPLVGQLIERGALDSDGKFVGWLKELSDLRNSLIHKRPYGHHPDEGYGRIREVGNTSSVMAYHRLLVRDEEGPEDILVLFARLYRSSMILFREAALTSGYNYEGWEITDRDFIEEPR